MKRAFTLLELLIVISIMFVLLSIYMGRVYSRAMEAGRLTQCSSNLRQLFIAAEIYVDLTGTTPIWDEYPDDADRRRVFDGLPDTLFRCPSDPEKGINRRGGHTSYDLSGITRLRSLSTKRVDAYNNDQTLDKNIVVFRDYVPSHYKPSRQNSIRLGRSIKPYPDPISPPRNPR
jgi:prepilin-type N-terminal cleavage/methylation domain-containing protein